MAIQPTIQSIYLELTSPRIAKINKLITYVIAQVKNIFKPSLNKVLKTNVKRVEFNRKKKVRLNTKTRNYLIQTLVRDIYINNHQHSQNELEKKMGASNAKHNRK